MDVLNQAWQFVHGTGSYLIPFLVVLGVVVFVHEFGHFWVARRCGVKIESFSLGFGPEIKGWDDSYGTHWRLAWLPLGGYVKMFGDADPASFGVSEEVKQLSEDEKRHAFYTQSVEKRFAIAGAGPFANYVFGILILALLFTFSGQPFTPPVAEKVMEGSAAAEAGIIPGDKIISISGSKTQSFEDIKRIIMLNTGTPVVIAYERDGLLKDVTLTPKVSTGKDRFGFEHQQAMLGIMSESIDHRQLSAPKAIVAAVRETWNLSAATLRGVGQMIMGTRGTDELGGPLRIAEMSGKVAEDGMATLIWFMAVISVNLGLINLFPIPLLDGGHLLFCIVEKLRGRPVSERIQDYGARMGALLVLSLMLFATWNDLVHLRVVSYVKELLFS